MGISPVHAALVAVIAPRSGTFLSAMDLVLAPVLGHHTVAYLDDVAITLSSFSDHLQHLYDMLGLLVDDGMKLNVREMYCLEPSETPQVC